MYQTRIEWDRHNYYHCHKYEGHSLLYNYTVHTTDLWPSDGTYNSLLFNKQTVFKFPNSFICNNGMKSTHWHLAIVWPYFLYPKVSGCQKDEYVSFTRPIERNKKVINWGLWRQLLSSVLISFIYWQFVYLHC